MNRIRELAHRAELLRIDSESESRVLRIVNLDKDTTELNLRDFLHDQMHLELKGAIEKIFVGNDPNLALFFAYIIFEFNSDAMKTARKLNGFLYKALQLDADVISPYSNNYKKYRENLKMPTRLGPKIHREVDNPHRRQDGNQAEMEARMRMLNRIRLARNIRS